MHSTPVQTAGANFHTTLALLPCVQCARLLSFEGLWSFVDHSGATFSTGRLRIEAPSQHFRIANRGTLPLPPLLLPTTSRLCCGHTSAATWGTQHSSWGTQHSSWESATATCDALLCYGTAWLGIRGQFEIVSGDDDGLMMVAVLFGGCSVFGELVPQGAVVAVHVGCQQQPTCLEGPDCMSHICVMTAATGWPGHSLNAVPPLDSEWAC